MNKMKRNLISFVIAITLVIVTIIIVRSCKVIDVHTAQILQSLVTSVGIIVGGFWTYILFIKNRQIYPMLNIEHLIEQRDLKNGYVHLRIETKLTNLGKVLINTSEAQVEIKQVLPLPEKLAMIMSSDDDPNKFNESEYEWPIIHKREHINDDSFHVEPGESEVYTSDFFIRNNILTVIIYSFIKNDSKNNDIGWSGESMLDLVKD